jgi:GNAT superfamily N-acetyltransferase
MFMVMVGGEPAGCMGIRLVDDHTWDVYNVILGVPELRGSGLMRNAFQAMLRFAASRHAGPITLKVLKGNPAMDWYRRNGFVISAAHPDYFFMSYRPLQCHHDNP